MYIFATKASIICEISMVNLRYYDTVGYLYTGDKMKKKNLIRCIVMITQVGFSMLAPIALCVAIGIWVDNEFDVVWPMPFLILLGIAAAYRNTYKLLLPFLKQKSKAEKKEDYIEMLKSEGAKKREDKEQ